MNTQTLIEAISFINSHEPTQRYIQQFENPPKVFEIYQVSASVFSYQRNIVRVLINFSKRTQSDVLREDAYIDVQGTNITNFRILGTHAVHIGP